MAHLWHDGERSLGEIGRMTPSQVAALVCHPRGPNGQVDLAAGPPAPEYDHAAAARRYRWRLGLEDR